MPADGYPRSIREAADVTEEVEDAVRSTITSSPDGFTVRDADGRFVQTFRFGEGQEALALARRLDSLMGVSKRDA